MMTLTILLQQSQNPLLGLWPFLLMIPVVYFFMIRPQQKKQKEQTSFSNSLDKGKEVVTASGIIGKVSKVDGEIVTLQLDTKTFMRVTKSAISKEMTDQLFSVKKDD